MVTQQAAAVSAFGVAERPRDDLGPAIVAVQAATKGWEPGTAVDQASASLISTLQGLTDAGIWFAIVWLPMLLVLAIFGTIGFVVARRLGVGRGRSTPPTFPPTPPAIERVTFDQAVSGVTAAVIAVSGVAARAAASAESTTSPSASSVVVD